VQLDDNIWLRLSASVTKYELLFIFSLLNHQLKSNEKMILTMELQQLVQRQVLWCNVKNAI
jgi:hypothetical protein